MERFVHRQNLERFRKQLAEAKDEKTREMLAKLLADEEAKDAPAQRDKHGS
jgi:bacterioferritin (cytochrome b1)